MIRATLIADDQCEACGVTAKAVAPVLTLCRQLVAAGMDPASPMEVYRGDTLALYIRSIGPAARMSISSSNTGRPILVWSRPGTAAQSGKVGEG